MCGVYFQSFSIFIQSFFKIGSKKQVKTMKICSQKRLFSKQVHIKTITVKKLPNVFLNLENSSENSQNFIDKIIERAFIFEIWLLILLILELVLKID